MDREVWVYYTLEEPLPVLELVERRILPLSTYLSWHLLLFEDDSSDSMRWVGKLEVLWASGSTMVSLRP